MRASVVSPRSSSPTTPTSPLGQIESFTSATATSSTTSRPTRRSHASRRRTARDRDPKGASMSTAVLAPLAGARPPEGGAPARRAVIRWAWRLFRREWRQQFLILALIVVAVVATIVGSAVATNTPQPKNFGFGTAGYSASFPSFNAHAQTEIANFERRFGPVEV